MTDRPIPLAAALTGVVSVVLLFAGQAIGGGGSRPDLTASRAAHAAWLAKQHLSAGRYAGVMLELLGIVLLIAFAATLWSVLRRGDGDGGVVAATAFGAGVGSAVLKLSSIPAVFAVMWRSQQGFDPQVATALLDMNDAAFTLTWLLDGVMLGAAAVVIFRSAVLPRWLGWLGAVAAAISLASIPVANHVPPIGILLTFVWIVGTSIVLIRRAVHTAPRSAMATA